MNLRTLGKLVSVSFVLSSSAALADWRDDGNLRRKKVRSYEEAERAEQDRGLSLGLRAGYGGPFGRFGSLGKSEGGEVGDSVANVIPLQLDAGYFFNSHLSLGAFFQYGVGLLSEDCPDGGSCSARQLRFGVNVAYHFQPTETLEPWVGLGVGYEVLDMNVSTGEGGLSARVGTAVRGLEFASLQGGLDYRVSRTFSVGPFVTLTAGQYSVVTSRIEADEDSPFFEDVEATEDIERKALHAWLQGGVRMQVRF